MDNSGHTKKNNDINIAIDQCNEQNDCDECISGYTGINGNTNFVPCNLIKIMYDEDICDYM